MKRSDKFYPGWRMTPAQHRAYFNLLEGVYRARGITKAADKEAMRKQIHQQAFGRPVSAKDIDHMKMFDEFKSVCLAMSQPDNLDAQMRQAEMPLIRLRTGIRSLVAQNLIPQPYWQKILFVQVGTTDLDAVKEEWKLEWFRNRLCELISSGEFDRADESDLVGERETEPVSELEGLPF